MTLHLIKMAVGIDSIAHLARVQRRRLEGGKEILVLASGQRLGVHRTRNMPRRAAEILAGGSIYWVIAGRIRGRQRILAIDRQVDGEGRGYCALGLDSNLVLTEPRPVRPFQGWRYLEADAAPPDLGQGGEKPNGLPAGLAAELRALGLL